MKEGTQEVAKRIDFAIHSGHTNGFIKEAPPLSFVPSISKSIFNSCHSEWLFSLQMDQNIFQRTKSSIRTSHHPIKSIYLGTNQHYRTDTTGRKNVLGKSQSCLKWKKRWNEMRLSTSVYTELLRSDCSASLNSLMVIDEGRIFMGISFHA